MNLTYLYTIKIRRIVRLESQQRLLNGIEVMSGHNVVGRVRLV